MKDLRPRDALTFAPREFGRLFELALAAGQSEPGAPGATGGTGLSLGAHHGSQGPYLKAAAALKRELGSDELRYRSALYRFYAVMDLYARRSLDPWLGKDARKPETRTLHPAVLDVAASM